MKPHFRQFRRDLHAAAGGRCFYCGAALAFEGPDRAEGRDWLLVAVRTAMDADHVDPLIRGGAHAVANMVASCKPCNAAKRARTLEEYRFQLMFRHRRIPYRFYGENSNTPARDVLFVASESTIPALMARNCRKRPKVNIRASDSARKKSLQ